LNRRKQRKQKNKGLSVDPVSVTFEFPSATRTTSQRGRRGFEQKEAKEAKGDKKFGGYRG
jgi:hypothetical protein